MFVWHLWKCVYFLQCKRSINQHESVNILNTAIHYIPKCIYGHLLLSHQYKVPKWWNETSHRKSIKRFQQFCKQQASDLLKPNRKKLAFSLNYYCSVFVGKHCSLGPIFHNLYSSVRVGCLNKQVMAVTHKLRR